VFLSRDVDGVDDADGVLAPLFSPAVITVTTAGFVDFNSPDESTRVFLSRNLYPEERAYTGTMAAKRKQEFTAGRLCAREALRRLDIERYPLRVGKHREPLWPAGVVGSISHCQQFCGAAVANSRDIIALGLDAEMLRTLPVGVEALVCSIDERAALNRHRTDARFSWSTVLFSVKESIYKCLFPLCGYPLEFNDVSVTLDPEQGRFEFDVTVECVSRVVSRYQADGRFVVSDKHIFSGLTLG